MLRFLSAASLILCGLSCASFGQQQGDAAKGRQLFMHNGCYECHGTQGAGGGIAGPALAPDPLPVEAITAQLRHPAQRMPPYSDSAVPDSDIADIHAYLQSIPEGKPASEIPLLKQHSPVAK